MTFKQFYYNYNNYFINESESYELARNTFFTRGSDRNSIEQCKDRPDGNGGSLDSDRDAEDVIIPFNKLNGHDIDLMFKKCKKASGSLYTSWDDIIGFFDKLSSTEEKLFSQFIELVYPKGKGVTFNELCDIIGKPDRERETILLEILEQLSGKLKLDKNTKLWHIKLIDSDTYEPITPELLNRK